MVLPNKKQLVQHLSDKMTNQDIANIYGTSFQKIIQLIKKYQINSNELRKVNNYIVYEHWNKGEVVYVGSGVWYRCRRYTNRRNSEHRRLMQEGKLLYKIVAEFSIEEEARQYEANLIKKYKQIGQAKFNKQTS
ncbi:hypothetical protein QNH39_07035 [Neobacillus novalis]|uniref:GIY-YIG domain-containing protein n=1 Tax=Neobacillus novalis TaxID=220687 RepID=A0AA95MP07_9BACI|nr:hypothetical protein [Neobacillus novalis]WHY87577.1 hypothetical protein QNH39_07035 [Neobacillus novalis]